MEINQSAALNGPVQAQPAAKPTLSSDFETFLKMLTAQMKNQDPLKPMESTEFAVQLATFSNVEQQVKTNDLLAGLSTQMSLLGMGQLAGWVGMDGRAQMPAYYQGQPIEVIPNPAAVADVAHLVVRDATGAEVQRMPIPVSGDPLSWTGRDSAGYAMPTGIYQFEVESFSGGKLLDISTAEVYARIHEARGENGATVLAFPGGIRVEAQSIIGIRAPVS